jgi:hypothetical protein
MEARSSDLTGALQLEAYRAKHGEAGSKPPFFGSFFIHVKGAAYQHTAFQAFWHNYKATSNKHVTIRRGERWFSRSMIDAGITHDYIFSRRLFDAWVLGLDNAALSNVLADLVSMNSSHHAERLRLIQAEEKNSAWQKQAVHLVYAMTEKQNILSSAPIACLNHFRVPYIKKSADPHNLQALSLIVQRYREGAIKIDETVYEEICQVLAKHGIGPH